MSNHRRRPSSPAAAPPLEDENLLSEILLLLPPEPSSLTRASAVCKRWRHLVSDPRFIRRFRRHHHSNPPLLGAFHPCGGLSFEPTLEAPNRVAPGRFSLQHDRGDRLLPLGSHHGLVLLLDLEQQQVLVWDPVTGDQHCIALPTRFGAEYPTTAGAVLRPAGDVYFQVVLVVADSDDELHRGGLACVYSSETGLWGNLISTPLPSTNVSSIYPEFTSVPAVLVGDSLYWILIGGDFTGILEFDLDGQCLAVIPLPTDIDFPTDVDFQDEHQLRVMRAEGGGLGFLFLSKEDLSAQLWKRKTDCDGVASRELGRTIELDKLLSLNSGEERHCSIIGFAECNVAVFLWTVVGVFMLELESLQVKKVSEARDLLDCLPFESVYAAGV